MTSVVTIPGISQPGAANVIITPSAPGAPPPGAFPTPKPTPPPAKVVSEEAPPSEPAPAEEWKPDFSKENPYEGMPPEYAELVGRTFVPTEDVPLSPVQEAALAGQIKGGAASSSAVQTLSKAQQALLGVTVSTLKEVPTAKAAIVAAAWKPDFSKANPWEGMPIIHAEQVAKTFVPTPNRIYSPVQEAAARGQLPANMAAKVSTLTQTQQQLIDLVKSEVMSRNDLERLRTESPKLYNVILTQGVDEYNAAISAEAFARQQAINRLGDIYAKDAKGNIVYGPYTKDEQGQAVRGDPLIDTNRVIAYLQKTPSGLSNVIALYGTDTANQLLAYAEQMRVFGENLPSLPKVLQDAYKSGGMAAYNTAVNEYNETTRTARAVFPPKGETAWVSADVSALARSPGFAEKYATIVQPGNVSDVEYAQVKPFVKPWGFDLTGALVAKVPVEVIRKVAGESVVEPLGLYVSYLDKGVIPQPDIIGTKLGLSGAEISSMGRALDQLGVKPVDGSYVVAWRSLDEDTKLQAAITVMNDPYKGNAFASVVRDVEYLKAKLPIPVQYGILGGEIALAFAVPPVGMTLMAAEAVAPTLAKATVGEKVTAMEIAVDAAMVALATLTHVPPAILATARPAVTALNVGALGIFGTNLVVNWDEMGIVDRYLNVGMLLIPAIGLSRSLVKSTQGKSVTSDPVKLAEQQRAVLDRVIQTNKDFISQEIVKNPATAVEAQKAYDVMKASVEEYSTTSLEFKQTQKAISDIGLAKTRGELAVLEGLKAKERTLSDNLRDLRNPLEKSIAEFNGTVLKDLKVSDPTVLKEINDMPGKVRTDLDAITNQIVAPRTAIEIAKDVNEVTSRISEMEGYTKDVAKLSLEQAKAYSSLITDLNSQLVSLNKEVRLRYLSTGEEAKTVKGGDLILETKSLQQRLIEARSTLEDYRKSSLEYKTYRTGELVGEAKVVTVERDIFEAIQKVYEPIAGKESYASVLERLNETLDSVVTSLRELRVPTDKAVRASFDIYDAVVKGDVKALKVGVAALQIEANRVLQLGAGEQVKLLGARAEDVMNMFRYRRAPPSIVKDVLSSEGLDWETLLAGKIRQEAERIVDNRWSKLTERLPDYVLKRKPLEIREYLKELRGKDYIDDLLDVDKVEAELRAEQTRQSELEAKRRDIESHEAERRLTDSFREKTTNPETKKILDDHAAELRRVLETKKKELRVAEKQRLTIPLVETRTLEGPVKKEEALISAEEKSLTEREAERRAVERVAKAKEEIAREKAKESVFPGITTVKITTRTGQTSVESAKHIGAMTPEQAQRLYGEEMQVDAVSTQRVPSVTELVYAIPKETRWLSPADAVKEAQQISIQQQAQSIIQQAQQLQTQGATQTQLQNMVQTALQSLIQQQTSLQQQTELQTQLQTELRQQLQQQLQLQTLLRIETPPPPPPPPIIILPKGKAPKKPRVVTLPSGSIAWRMGALKGGDVIKYIPPPYTQLKPTTLVGRRPTGWIDKGRTPQETLQIIGEARDVPGRISIDLGVADILVVDGKRIEFVGGGLKTDVGTRIPGPTKGMSIPAASASELVRERENMRRELGSTKVVATPKRVVEDTVTEIVAGLQSLRLL